LRAAGITLGLLAVASCGSVFDLEHVNDPPPCESPMFHDEDGDGFDDACDVCPAFADARQADRDHDGVGDVCDPSPETPGDTLAKFMAFATALEKDNWSAPAGWSVADDAFVYAGGNTFIELVGSVPAFPFEIQLGVTFTSVDRSKYTQLLVHGAEGAGPGPHCAYYHVTSGGDELNAAPSTPIVELPTTYNTGSRFVMRETYSVTELACRIEGETAAGDPISGMTSEVLASPAPGKIAVTISQTAMQIDWFAIYTLP
jgi:hypothetical protein